MRLRWLVIVLMSCLLLHAQEEPSVVFVGSLQHGGLFAEEDEASGAKKGEFAYLNNTYLDLGIRSKYVSAGLRGELMYAPLPGFEAGFKGGGLSNIYVKGECQWGSLTIGDVYGQFGSGLILRLYEERSLGIDNSLRGGKLTLTPYKGIYAELLGGKQRNYWNCYTDGAFGMNYRQNATIGGNLELQIDDWSEKMQDMGMNLLLGGSYVSNYQAYDNSFLLTDPNSGEMFAWNVPEWVGAGDVRAKFQMKGWNALAEFAYKANNPSADNSLYDPTLSGTRYLYNPGQALLLSLSYSRSGMSALVQVKRSEYMSFRSDRNVRGTGCMLNHLPAFATQHTYALAALYPYATQMDGEWAFQGELRYTWKRKTPMGGKYGTTMKLSASHVRSLGEVDPATGSHGNWFAMKETYYTDVNLELNKKVSKDWYINALVMYEAYNQSKIESHGEMVHAGIGVVDVKWNTSKNVSMRAELQYLFTKQAEGHWLYGLYELSLWHQLMLSVSDMYNIGGVHYYNAGATYMNGAHRLQLSYGRTRAGYNCSGGVCRYVPAQKGFAVTYNFSW